MDNQINFDFRKNLSAKSFEISGFIDLMDDSPKLKVEIRNFPVDLLKQLLGMVLKNVDKEIQESIRKQLGKVNFDADNTTLDN